MDVAVVVATVIIDFPRFTVRFKNTIKQKVSLQPPFETNTKLSVQFCTTDLTSLIALKTFPITNELPSSINFD